MISKLHLITQDHLNRSHEEQAVEFFKGGGKWIQFRTKTLSEQETIEQALAIKAAAEEYNAIAILNDNWELAKDLKLDGVHVGLSDTPIEVIRSKVKKDFIIGGTSNELKDIQLHNAHGANYIGLGPFRFTSTKEKLSSIYNYCSSYHRDFHEGYCYFIIYSPSDLQFKPRITEIKKKTRQQR